MKSYLPIFDWNNGDEVNPWDWLWDDEDKSSLNNKSIKITIRKK
jgi:hypothetical protein